jgi:drug/metabolite transporter superfamily protein YnfA
MSILAAVAIYVGAAIAEIAGCYSVRTWLRLE